MFGNLLKYYNGTDDTYLREHPYLYTYAENGVGIWQIFSVYETTTDEYYIETYFETRRPITVLSKTCRTNLFIKLMFC